MKNLFVIPVMIVLVVGLVFSGCAAPAPAPAPQPEKPPKVIVIKMASWLPEGGTEGKMGKWWGSELEKRSGGRVKMEYYFSQALVKTMDLLPAVTKGITDIAHVGNGYFPSQLPLCGAFELIYQTNSAWVQDKAFNEMAETWEPLKQELRNNNIMNLASLAATEMVMGANKPIKTLEDLQGMKIRAMGLANEVMAILGATPVAIALPEVYESMERGTIDAYTGLPYHLVVAFKLSEVSKYIVNPGVGCFVSGSYYMNLDTWDKLPDDIKAIIKDLNAEFTDQCIKSHNEDLKKTTETLLEAGKDIYSITPAEVERWKSKLVPKIYDDWVAKMESKGLPGKETLEQYQSLIKKYAPNDKYVNPYPK